MFYIYRITNTINQKVYIGQTNNPLLRWSQHKSNSKYNRGNQVITRAIIKYGIKVFVFDVIAGCISQENIDLLEEQVIAQYNSRNPNEGYNIAAGGNTSLRTPEISQKISAGLKKHYMDHVGWSKGKTLTEEWKNNISKASLGKPGTNKGKRFSKEWKAKISTSLVGKSFSEDHKKHLSESHIGNIAANRKLTFEIAEQIRKEYIAGLTQKQLAIKYGISQNCIFKIIKKRTYTQ